jgi:hypothetical protein
MLNKDLVDELPAIALGLANLFQSRRSEGNHSSGASGGPASKSFLVTLAEIGVKWWEQSGGSMKDEAELLKTLHGDTGAKHTKLELGESKKIAALIGAMEGRERVVFRLALFLMEPEIKVITTPERKEKDKDGKERVVKAATSTTERTGVDMRINTLTGIAALINDDLSNVAEVALMLRDEGTLGSENKTLRLYRGGVLRLQKGLCQLFGVDTIDKVTTELVSAKIGVWVNKKPTPVPMSLLGRCFNALLIGSKEIPEPIFQGDGPSNVFLRMLGIQTKKG